ncbi:MAG: sigma-54-dependent Fis family transcriptional regulator [Deltaproteobacteria bacterium]|nr:sigma-54-dependent Fis family transcriptional regulator [Deltaproteobacteria bacterium]MBW2122625.1 sigma-54-dependent Fis family transcriptional regulator [Deltaproteobacteria bacterium]
MIAKRVMVIDDEENVCRSCKEILMEDGYEVETFTSPKGGLERLKEEGFDLVLLDLKMPEMDGIEMLKKLRQEHQNTGVIVITGYATVDTAVVSMKLGAFDYVAKPFTPDELSMVVGKAFEHQRLVTENRYLREELTRKFELDNIVGQSDALRKVCELIKRVAPTDTTVLIQGESGTGKELVARDIHRYSQRRDKAFVIVDCATLAQNVIESELFGYVKGAFTGATGSKEGLFETANGGTIFLDEIANISLEIQAKLLRVIQEQEFKRVGDSKSRKVDVRFIAATNRDLERLIKEKVFREDLLYRLDVFRIFLPPLRDRKEDIAVLANYFLDSFARAMHKDIRGFSREALEVLEEYGWPGNVRELKNVMERLVIMSDEAVASSSQVCSALGDRMKQVVDTVPKTAEELKQLRRKITKRISDDLESAFVMDALRRNNGNVTRAAEDVGMLRPNFHALMRKHGISAKS